MNMAKLALMYDDDSKESEQSTSRSTEKSRRRRGTRGSKKRNHKPWDVSSESETTVEEVTEEEEEEVEEEPLVFTIDDDEFACEEIIEDEEPVVIRKARTAKKVSSDVKEGEEQIVLDDKPCGKCGKHDRPEWILLCDNCDDGYHTSCLIPELFTIPDGDWFCQPCEHLLLCECLSKELQKLDQLLNKREREELRKQRLAYVGISLDNVLKPEKKESEAEETSSDESSEKERKPKRERNVRARRDSSEDDLQKSIYSKRSSRCRQRVNYQFKEYDELIASAIQEDLFDVKMAEEFVPKEKNEKTDEDDDDDDDDSYTGPAATRISRPRRKKPRRLNDLDFSDEDDSGDDYKGLSTDTEHTPSVHTEVSNSGSNASGEWRIVRPKSKSKSKSRNTRSSRKKRRNRYSSSDEEISESDESNYRPTTRRATQKSISYREISSEDEWEEFPKKSAKRKKKETSSDTSEASDKSPKLQRSPKSSKKWGESTSESESSESAESSSTKQSASEWKIEKKSSEGGRIKININKRQIESDSSNSSSKQARVKKRANRLVSDEDSDEEEDDENEESNDEETDEGESSDSSEKSEEEEDGDLPKKSEGEKIPSVKPKITTDNARPVLAKPPLKSKTSEVKPGVTSKVVTNPVKPNPKVLSQERTPGGTPVKVAAVPNIVGIPKNVVCQALALNREKVSSSQIVVKTVVVKTVPKGSIKEIKMVPSKIPYKDKIDSNEPENRKIASIKDAPRSPMPTSPAPNSPIVKGPSKTISQTIKTAIGNLPSSPKNAPQHKSVISNVPPAGKHFPMMEQQRFNIQQQQMSPKNMPQHPFQHGMPDVIRGHPMQNIPGPNGQLPLQRFSNPMMEPHPRGNHMMMRNLAPQRFLMDPQMRQHPPMQIPINRPPHPNVPVGGPPHNYSSPILEHQAPMQQVIKPAQQPYSGSIVEPFSTADIDQGSDSRDEVPIERIPSASNSPPVELIPTKEMPENEYLPAKDGNYPYSIPEEKGFPPSYSPLSSLQEFTSRPSPLKPSVVENYPSNSASPTRLTSLDNYSQANSPKGFISLDTFSRKKAAFGGSPSESGPMPRHSGEHFQGEARFSQEPYPSSPGSFQQRSSTPQQQRDPGTPPRLYSQFQDSYAPPRSPEFYQNQQQPQYYNMEEGGTSGTQRSNYQPNFTPSENSSYSYTPNAMQQPNNDGFMIDTILRARNEEDELGNVSGIVQYITQQ